MLTSNVIKKTLAEISKSQSLFCFHEIQFRTYGVDSFFFLFFFFWQTETRATLFITDIYFLLPFSNKTMKYYLNPMKNLKSFDRIHLCFCILVLWYNVDTRREIQPLRSPISDLRLPLSLNRNGIYFKWQFMYQMPTCSLLGTGLIVMWSTVQHPHSRIQREGGGGRGERERKIKTYMVDREYSGGVFFPGKRKRGGRSWILSVGTGLIENRKKTSSLERRNRQFPLQENAVR